MINPTDTLARFNQTVRMAEEFNASRYNSAPNRLSADFQAIRLTAIRLTALHSVMNHRPHQSEY